MTDSTKPTDASEPIDVQHVTCGLVPLMQTHLGGTEPEIETVEFKVRQGIQTELWNSFGTGSEWRLTDIRSDLFFDIASFVRVETSELDPLGLLEF